MTTAVNQPDAEELQKQAQAADALLFHNVFVPAFLEKMAQRGHRANNEAEAQELLKAAMLIENVPDSELFGTPAVTKNAYAAATQSLSDVLGYSEKQAAQQAENQAWSKAAEALNTIPDLYNSALLLHVLDQPTAAA